MKNNQYKKLIIHVFIVVLCVFLARKTSELFFDSSTIATLIFLFIFTFLSEIIEERIK